MSQQPFVVCTLKSLPEEHLIPAARTATNINPCNCPAPFHDDLVLEPLHLALLTSKYWGSGGVRLTVGFLDGAPADLQRRIVEHMNAWSQWANVQFVLTATDPQVRITRAEDGYWSYLGTDILHIPASQPTMNLQGFTMQMPESEFHRVVRHETGHTLAFPHEHMRRELVQRIDPTKAVFYFMQTQGWSARVTQQQVLTPLEESSLLGTEHADQTSVMTYSLPGSITYDGQPIVGGVDIDPSDQAFAAKVYPKVLLPPPQPPPNPPAPPVNPPAMAGILDLAVDLAKKSVTVQVPADWRLFKRN